MIQIPPGFDYVSLFSDFMLFLAPFVVVEGLFLGYKYVKRSINVM